MNPLEYFIYKIFPPMVTIFGLTGNFIGFTIMSFKSMSKLPVKNYYRFLFVSDSVFISQSIISYMQYGLNFDPTISSIYFCKIFNYLNYCLSTISPLLIVIISSERLIAIKFSQKSYILSNFKFQIIYLIIIIVYGLLFYAGIAVYFDLVNVSNDTNETIIQCTFNDPTALVVLSYMDLVNRAIIPSLLMIICSIWLSFLIFKSRKRVSKNKSIKENKNFQRDLKFTMTSIFLNLVYVFLNLPISITIFFPNYQQSTIYVFSFFLFYLSYGINFYIIITFNSLIRNQFLIFLRIRQKKNALSTNTITSNRT